MCSGRGLHFSESLTIAIFHTPILTFALNIFSAQRERIAARSFPNVFCSPEAVVEFLYFREDH